MINLPEQKIRWLLAELTVVVLGILLVLQIDEWRLAKKERAEELVALTSAIEAIDGNIAGLDRFVALIGNLREQNLQSFAQSFNDLTMLSGWRPISPAYTGLRDTGRLDLIGSSELRTKLYNHYEIRHPNWSDFSNAISQARTDVNHAASMDIFHSARGSSDSAVARIMKTNHSSAGEMQFTVVLPLNEIPRSAALMPALGRLDARLRNGMPFLTAIRDQNRNLLESIESYLQNTR